MSQPILFPYSDALVNAVVGDYGWPEQYFEDRFFWDPERIKRTQDVRLRNEIARAATVPFYKRLWERAGADPRSIHGVQDLHRLPMYTVEDLRESIALAPPYGDHQGVLPGPNATGLRIYFSAGTTGRPRPAVYTTWDRLAGGCISARSMYLHGCRPGQTVLNAWAYGPHNLAWSIDEVLWFWLGCTPITVSSGRVTGLVKQLELAADYRAASICAPADHLLELRRVADEQGYTLSDFNVSWLSTVGNTAAASRAWGVPAYESYAFHEVQVVATECLEGQGMHVMEDAFVVEIVDPESGEPVPDGTTGDMVVTCLYKSGSPQIRYRIKDLAALVPGECVCGGTTRRLSALTGP